MATGLQLRGAVDQTLKSIRIKATEMRTMVWREGATTDPRAVLNGMDRIFEMIVEMESLLQRERMAQEKPPYRKTPK